MAKFDTDSGVWFRKSGKPRAKSDNVGSSTSFNQLQEEVNMIKEQVRRTAEALSSSAATPGTGQSSFDTFFRRLNDICSSGIFFILYQRPL